MDLCFSTVVLQHITVLHLFHFVLFCSISLYYIYFTLSCSAAYHGITFVSLCLECYSAYHSITFVSLCFVLQHITVLHLFHFVLFCSISQYYICITLPCYSAYHSIAFVSLCFVLQHITVFRRGVLYKLDMFDKNGRLLTPTLIQRQLDWIIRDADKHAGTVIHVL